MGFIDWLRDLLAHPSLRGVDLNDPRTTELRRAIIKDNGFLHRLYESWYAALLNQVPGTGNRVLELGSGGGFLAETRPGIITSEVFYSPHAQVILNGERLPFSGEGLSAIVMTNVLHHIPDPRLFFTEAARCLRPGGLLAMIEPWNTLWSRFIYGHLHHEPFDPQAARWEFASDGPLSSANGAIPWLVFERDRAIFEKEFPEFQIQSVQLLMPLCYLVSGGVSMRPLMPLWSYPFWSRLETWLEPWSRYLAMFACIRVRKVSLSSHRGTVA